MTQTAVALHETTALPGSPVPRHAEAARVRLVPPMPPARPIEAAPSRLAPRPAVTGATTRPAAESSPETSAQLWPPARAERTAGGSRPSARKPCGLAHAPAADPKMTSCLIAVAAVEVLTGLRPVAQLARWVSPQVYDQVALRATIQAEGADQAPQPRGRPTTRRVRMCRISDDIVETTVVVHHRERVRAVAVRLEMRRGRWRAEALVVG